MDYNYMDQTHLEKITYPIREAYNTDRIGFIFVFPEDANQYNFQEHGGIVINLPFKKDEFRQEIFQRAPEYKFQ